MMSLLTPIPIPRPEPSSLLEERRLWIGNLDSRITDGALAGQPRGYGFVTFKSKEDAEAMKYQLDGKKLGSKCISVKWAHSLEKGDDPKQKVETVVIPALGVKKERKISPQMQIKAIEMKLKMMEHSGVEEFKIDVPSTSLPRPCNRPSSTTDNKAKQLGLRHQPYHYKK